MLFIAKRVRRQYCCIFGFVVFHMLLFFVYDVLPALMMCYPEVFLDKVCIHQLGMILRRIRIGCISDGLFFLCQ